MCDVRLFVFLLLFFPHGLVQVCEKELSNMGKINRNPDLVCENTSSNPECQIYLTAPHTNDGLFFFLTFHFHCFILTLLLEILMQLKGCLLQPSSASKC